MIRRIFFAKLKKEEKDFYSQVRWQLNETTVAPRSIIFLPWCRSTWVSLSRLLFVSFKSYIPLSGKLEQFWYAKSQRIPLKFQNQNYVRFESEVNHKNIMYNLLQLYVWPPMANFPSSWFWFDPGSACALRAISTIFRKNLCQFTA